MQDEDYEHAHSSPIQTPQQLVVVLVLAFAVPVVGIILLTQFVTRGQRPDPGTLAPEAVAARIQPVARVEFAEARTTPRVPKTGEEVYQSVCAACHGQGLAGSPKVGDQAAWAPRIKQGLAALVKNAINGIKTMPPRGGNPDLSDYEIERAIVFMANQSGASWKESAPPSASAKQRTGEQIVTGACGNCHLTGEGGAPKIGDKAAWTKRMSQGIDAVTASAIRGHGGMPARGGFPDLTDAEIRAAILYMFGSAGAKPVPETAASAPVQTAAATPAPLSASAGSNGDELLQKYGCLACHALDKKVVGPSYKEVAAKYAADKTAAAKLAQKVKAGGAGVWGQVPMPPNPQVADSDLQTIIKYILALK